MSTQPGVCPVHHNNSSSSKFIELASTPSKAGAPSGCPVPHEARQQYAAQAGHATPTSSTAQTGAAASPMGGSNCSSENMERAPASEFPSAQFDSGFKGQSQDPNWHYIYSTSIPSTDDAGNSPDGRWWVGPSANQLMRALHRKKKADGISQDEVRVVSAIHSVVTETTWAAIMEYESLHSSTCPKPTLTKFEGKWDQLSPKAQILVWLGYDKPFDRHDWTVNRCGEEHRYIIDYYGATNQHGFHIDARPVLTPSGIVDRVRVASNRIFQALFPPKTPVAPFKAPPAGGAPA